VKVVSFSCRKTGQRINSKLLSSAVSVAFSALAAPLDTAFLSWTSQLTRQKPRLPLPLHLESRILLCAALRHGKGATRLSKRGLLASQFTVFLPVTLLGALEPLFTPLQETLEILYVRIKNSIIPFYTLPSSLTNNGCSKPYHHRH
jgi:hypothetical protein